jgi:chromate transporter
LASLQSEVTPLQLFLGFAKTGLRGFGGVLSWARRLVVEERAWLSPGEFSDVLSLCQFLPGPNIVNVSIVVGVLRLPLVPVLGALAPFSFLVVRAFQRTA